MNREESAILAMSIAIVVSIICVFIMIKIQPDTVWLYVIYLVFVNVALGVFLYFNVTTQGFTECF